MSTSPTAPPSALLPLVMAAHSGAGAQGAVEPVLADYRSSDLLDTALVLITQALDWLGTLRAIHLADVPDLADILATDNLAADEASTVLSAALARSLVRGTDPRTLLVKMVEVLAGLVTLLGDSFGVDEVAVWSKLTAPATQAPVLVPNSPPTRTLTGSLAAQAATELPPKIPDGGGSEDDLDAIEPLLAPGLTRRVAFGALLVSALAGLLMVAGAVGAVFLGFGGHWVLAVLLLAAWVVLVRLVRSRVMGMVLR